ncbi:MAG: hypothetical protein N2235_17600, partial [Fischerella sp.]|nr:hypothetical protein [Fischerella sp.]
YIVRSEYLSTHYQPRTFVVIFCRNGITQRRSYLQQAQNQRSRQQLTSIEITQFLNYLKFLPTPASS